MKITRIVLLSITALLCNNLQSMDSPFNSPYSLEERLLNGDISTKKYLSLLEQTWADGWMLKDLRTAQYTDPMDAPYTEWINHTDGQLNMLRRTLETWNAQEQGKTKEEGFATIVKNIYESRRLIPVLHARLMEMIRNGQARMPIS